MKSHRSTARRVFASIAGGYDTMNRIMSLGMDKAWRRAALGMVESDPATALDLACGTGDSTVEIARRFPDAAVTGADFSPEMISIAENKTRHLQTVKFRAADAADLQCFRDGEFRLVFCAFGFRNFPDKAKVLRECRRVLAEGGELVVLELFRPRFRFLGALVNLWIASTAFFFAHGKSAEYKYLRDSVSKTLTAGEFTGLARENGFLPVARRSIFPSATCLKFAAARS